VAFNLESLRTERDQVKKTLLEIETESRKLEAEVKNLRQREVQAKREIEAYNALIEIEESRTATSAPAPSVP
jgi:septation ring formation regulator EzrA